MLFLSCLEQHSKDRGLESIGGWQDSKYCGLTPQFLVAEMEVSEDEAPGALALALGAGVGCKEPHQLYLGGRSPRYWVCGSLTLTCMPIPIQIFAYPDQHPDVAAYANNQFTLDTELITDELAQTSFFKAMRLAKAEHQPYSELSPTPNQHRY